MTLWFLFLRSRRAFPAAAGLLLCAALCGMVGRRWADLSDVVLLTSVLVPLAAATIIGVTASSPFGELEQTLSRPLAPLRLSLLAGLLVLAATGLFGAVTTWHDATLGWQFVRNLLGLTGMGMLATQVAGGRWSWAAPVGFCALALFLRGALGDHLPRWAWVVQPASHMTTGIALTLLIAGLSLAVFVGPREVDTDSTA